MANLTGSTTAVFFVRLSAAVDEIVDVDWSTRDGTAIAGKDYDAASGTVSFLPSETEKAIDVVVYGQDDVTADGKKFYIELKPPANAVLTDALAECVITVEDDGGVLVTSLVIAQGKRGLKGNPGLSAYEQAVLMGYTGTVEQWMAEIGDASQAADRAEGYAADSAASAATAEQKSNEAIAAVGSTQLYVDAALSNLSTAANKFYPTLADANADIANIQVDQPVTIGESANGGLWYKATAGATSLTKSAYDPLTQAKGYADANALFKPIKISNTNLNTLLNVGFYCVTELASATLALNFPKASIGFLEVIKAPLSSIVYQVYYADNTIYTRIFNGTSWSLWSDNGNSEIFKNTRKVAELQNIIDTAFITTSNIFSGAIPNTTINPQGNIVADSIRWLGDFISCASGEVFSVSSGSYRISYFDGNKSFISQIGSPVTTSFTVSHVNAKYFRLSGTTSLGTMQLNKGATLLPYEPFKLHPKFLPEQKILVEPEQTTFFNLSSNLFDIERAESNKSMDVTGAVIPDELRWLSDFIEVESGKTYSVPSASYRIIEFGENKNFISINATQVVSNFQITKPLIKFIKLSTTKATVPLSAMQMNEGSNLLPYEPFGVAKIKNEFLPDQEVDVEDLKQQLIAELTQTLLPKYNPSFPSLNFNESMSVSELPMWMSSDGTTIYGSGGSGGRSLMQSTDDWATRVQIGPAFSHIIMGVRTLDDGELLVSTTRTKNPDVYSKVWKSVGYDKNNPSSTTFKEVLVSTNIDAFFINSWGMSAYQNIVTISEYGERGLATGAKHVYLSTDYGDTFSLIFDLYATQVEGRPVLTEKAHMHTTAYDPYFNRIWVVVGDIPNTATYYSDDLGASWTYVTGSNAMQYTGIIALPDAVLFGSDRSPNGVHVYHRKDKYAMPKIEPLLKVNDLSTITHVFGLPFKKDWSPTSPVYFSAPTIQNTMDYAPCIVATVDGKKAFKMWEGNKGDNLIDTVGPTASGKIIAAIEVSTGNFNVMRALAPSWSK